MARTERSIKRRTFLAAGVAAAATLPTASVAAETPVVIRGVDPYRVYDPAFECVRVVLKTRGERCSPAYVQGVSGSGFRMGGPCPCAPTCAMAMPQSDLVRLLGYEAEELTFADRKDLKERLGEILPRIKAEIRAGRPVIVFHAFTSAEWDVVCGFDDAKHEFLGRGGYQNMRGREYARADQGRMITCVETCPPIGALIVGAKDRRFDARKAEMAALKEAVRHARDTKRKNYPFDGLAVYDRWQEHWRADDAKPDWLRDGYISAVYSSTHQAGSDFLREIKGRHRAASAHLERAAERLQAEARTLHQILALLFPGEGKPQPELPDLRRTMRDLLARARADYGAMADEIGEALPRLGA